MKRSKSLKLQLVIGFIVLALVLSACGISPQTATCAFIIGAGSGGYDAKVHKIVYPGQVVPESLTGEVVRYVPCNSRNYIINDGTVKVGEKTVGDRGTLTLATTSSGVQITIKSTALWTLNQSEQALRDFYTVCFKYSGTDDPCLSTGDQGGNANFSSEGWNGMLSENFGPSIDVAAGLAAFEVKDAIWQTHDPKEYQALADKMSVYFWDAVRARFGFQENLFCGSGNSGWPDPNKPGEGEFFCSPVRFIVEDVQIYKQAGESGTVAQGQLNAITLANAKAKYGDDAAGFWLGLIDSIEACKGSGATCIFNVGNSSGAPTINLPAPAPTAAP